jgi:hypothetical protein
VVDGSGEYFPREACWLCDRAKHPCVAVCQRNVRTGRANGGQQLHFLNPQNREIHSSTKAIGEGVDVKGWHSLALIPDSIHPKTGRRYEWENHFDRVELPEPWAELIESTWLRKHPKKPETVSKENVSASAVAIVPELTHHEARHFGFRTLLSGQRTNGLLPPIAVTITLNPIFNDSVIIGGVFRPTLDYWLFAGTAHGEDFQSLIERELNRCCRHR